MATATPGLAARLTVPARPGETYSVYTRLLITVFSVALLAWHGLPDAARPRGPDELRPSVRLDVQQISTDAAGERSFTVTDKRPVTWAVAASNRAGAISDEIMVRPVTFGSAASFITSGMEAAGGLWVGQLVIAFVPGLVIILVAVIKGNVTPAPFIVSGGLAPVLAFVFAALFNFTAGYWLAASLTILLVLAVVTWV